MGNITSSNTNENIKKLYSYSIKDLEKLKLYYIKNRRIEYLQHEKKILKKLFETQNVIKNTNRIPQIHILKVDNFLNQINSDIKEFELKNIKSGYETHIFNSFMPHNNNNKIDPYKIFGYNKSHKINIQDLKNKFKIFAKQTHPDRNNGDDTNFKIVKKSYDQILSDIHYKQEDKQFNTLKNNSHQYIDEQSNSNKKNKLINKDNFDINQFNELYSDNKITSSNDDGYTEWINNNKYDTEEITQNPKLNNNKSLFNKIFNETVSTNNQHIQKYVDPKELFMNNYNNCEELGIDTKQNFTGETKSMKFTDYKEAHTTNKLVENNTPTKSKYNTISEIKNARSKIKDFTQDEMEYYKQQQIQKELEEKKRLETQQSIDDLHFNNFNKLNKMMLH